ncbi:Uncharacterized protein Rs2_08653 [Raphanus sativus]|nr:Uncharacterized protein Rs2_08653 [Raphanus sativus]
MCGGRDGGCNGGDKTVNATDVTAFADLVETILTPSLTPRVLDDPVRLLLEPSRGITSGAVTDQQDTVVEPPGANIRAGDSANVSLHIGSVDGNSKRSVLNKVGSNTKGDW